MLSNVYLIILYHNNPCHAEYHKYFINPVNLHNAQHSSSCKHVFFFNQSRKQCGTEGPDQMALVEAS